MAEFISFDPNVEVRGQSMMSVIAGMSASARPLIEKYGLDKLEADKWYRLLDDSYGKHHRAQVGLFGLNRSRAEKQLFPALWCLCSLN